MTEFYRHRGKPQGRAARCKECHKIGLERGDAPRGAAARDGACACGCGQPTDGARAEAWRLWRELGTHKAVAERLGVTRQRVGQIINRNPPRFVLGHNGKFPQATRVCKRCSRTFLGWARDFYCSANACRAERDEKRNEALNAGAISLDVTDWRVNDAASLVVPSITDALEREEINDILGDLGLEDIPRLSESELERLRRELLAVGVIPSSVQGPERERLREPERHRGRSPAPAKTRMSTKRKHRKPGHQKSAGSKRGSRKQRTFRDEQRRTA